MEERFGNRATTTRQESKELIIANIFSFKTTTRF